MATHFEAVHAHGYSEKALRGYTAGLRLLAAYSAAELLGEAIGSNVTSWKIPDSALAAALRRVLLRPSADSNGLFAQKGLREKLQLFMDGDIDVRIPSFFLLGVLPQVQDTPTMKLHVLFDWSDTGHKFKWLYRREETHEGGPTP